MKDNDKINEGNDFGEERGQIVPTISLETKILAKGISSEEIDQFRQDAVEDYMTRRRSKDIKVISILLATLLVIVAFFVIKDNMEKKHYQLFETENRKKVMVRNLNYYRDEFAEDPVDREFAWDSELPELVIEDRQKIMDREVDEVWYCFCDIGELEIEGGKMSGNGIEISPKYFAPYNEQLSTDELSIIVRENGEYQNSLDGGFSMYKNENGFVIYWEDFLQFKKMEINETEIKETVIAENINLPFSEKQVLFTLKLPEGYVCVKKDGHTVRLYDNGNLIGEAKLEDEIIANFDEDFLYTKNNKVYFPYMVSTAKGKQFLVKEIANIDVTMLEANSYFYSDYSKEYSFYKKLRVNLDEENNMYFPIFWNKSDQMQVVVPEDIQLYYEYQKGKEITVTDTMEWKIIDLKKNFVKAEICFKESDSVIDDFNYCAWADIYFQIGKDRYGIYSYTINGFDDDVTITKGEIPEKQVVWTGDEFWDTIGKIRDTFAEYYDYQD